MLARQTEISNKINGRSIWKLHEIYTAIFQSQVFIFCHPVRIADNQLCKAGRVPQVWQHFYSFSCCCQPSETDVNIRVSLLAIPFCTASQASKSFSQEAAFKNYGGSKALLKRKSDFLPHCLPPFTRTKIKQNPEVCKKVTEVLFSLQFPAPQEQPKDYKTSWTTVTPPSSPSCNSQAAGRGGRETFPFSREN